MGCGPNEIYRKLETFKRYVSEYYRSKSNIRLWRWERCKFLIPVTSKEKARHRGKYKLKMVLGAASCMRTQSHVATGRRLTTEKISLA